MSIFKIFCLHACLLLSVVTISAQKPGPEDPVYADKKGVLRWTKTREEAAFFGVNYTVPFAYGYRSHRALGVAHERAIDADVAHMARLGLNAFRVHVWDVEISDSAGNLLQNEHLRLFDYLLWRLKQNGIRVLVTPIAFWGNGYPERDEKTPGFATKFGKGPSVVREEAFAAQENYLRQFFRHVNPYTKQSYRDDPNVIATEINNEPQHSGPRARTTEYVNRMAAAVRSTGWTKPVFYNISESPSYAGAVTDARVDGHSFQWYPTGLVANRTLRGNFLPHVDRYSVPFADSLPAFRTRARMVYEFDAGDVWQSVLYPAMARSFRTAGFQWATQFAYDPMATAYANTEYQTHFLNLVYTPAKALSLLIAGEVFRRVPRNRGYGAYPADSSFEGFRLSYAQDLSEYNGTTVFYHSNTTGTRPTDPARLQRIAGVGSSPLVDYSGTGAYFIDKIAEGRWRLEVYPDALMVADPYGKASPSREVVRVVWAEHPMRLRLPGLAPGFRIQGRDSANQSFLRVDRDGFRIRPGVYELSNQDVSFGTREAFFAPPSFSGAPFCVHQPLPEVRAGRVLALELALPGADDSATVSVEIRNGANRWKTLRLERNGSWRFAGLIPADMLVPGQLRYRVLLRQESGTIITFPSGRTGDPYAWDNTDDQTWSTLVLPPGAPLTLFSATDDAARVVPWIPDWRSFTITYPATGEGRQLALQATMLAPGSSSLMGFQVFVGDRVHGFGEAASQIRTLALRARSPQGRALRIALIDRNGAAWSTIVAPGAESRTVSVPLTAFRPDSALLLPRPYPGFQPLWFRARGETTLQPAAIDKLEITFGQDLPAGSETSQQVGIEWVRFDN